MDQYGFFCCLYVEYSIIIMNHIFEIIYRHLVENRNVFQNRFHVNVSNLPEERNEEQNVKCFKINYKKQNPIMMMIEQFPLVSLSLSLFDCLNHHHQL